MKALFIFFDALGGIYLNSKAQESSGKYYHFRIINLIALLIIIIWVGLTSPVSITLLGILTIGEINSKNR